MALYPVTKAMRNSLIILLSLTFSLSSAVNPARCADDLKLRNGLSFNQDIDNGFPIVCTNLEDCKISTATPTLIFFGASGDLNTNRQAKRVVDLYKKLPDKSVKFIVIDVDKAPNADAKHLISTYYKGYIPGEVLFDKTGKQVWNHDGEVELNVVKAQIDKLL